MRQFPNRDFILIQKQREDLGITLDEELVSQAVESFR